MTRRAMTDDADATKPWLPQLRSARPWSGGVLRDDARDCAVRTQGGLVAELVPRGFWVAAREDPDRVALFDADERAWPAGELLSGANQLVHALRARGV
jgi:hypothetical protein